MMQANGTTFILLSIWNPKNLVGKKRSELYMTWQGNGNVGREVCGQGKGPNMNYSNKVKKQFIQGSFMLIGSSPTFTACGEAGN